MSYSPFFRIISLLMFLSMYLSGYSQDNIEEYLKAKTVDKQVDTLMNLGEYYLETNQDSALYFYRKAIDLETNNPQRNDSTLFQLLFKVGEINKENQFYEVAGGYFKKALEAAPKFDDRELSLNVLIELGRINRRLGNYDLALEYDLKALSIVETLSNPKRLSLIYNFIGIDYYRYHNFDDAILNFNRSLEIRQKTLDSIGIADCYNNLGMVYDDIGDTASALDNYTKSLIIYEKKDEYDGIAASLNNMAGIYYQQDNFQMVMNYMLKALEIRRKAGDKRKLSYTLLNIASLYLSTNEIKKSIELNLEGLQLAKEIGAKSQKKIAYKGLSDAYFETNDYLDAYKYHILYSSVKDSIFKENKSRAIAEMQAKYETEKKEIENQLLKNENKAKSRNQIILIVAIVALILLLLMLIYYLRLRGISHRQQKALAHIELARKEQEKQNLKDKVFAEKQINKLQQEKFDIDIKHKNKELANSTLSLINKNEVLGKLRADIKSLEAPHTGQSEIISYINQNLDTENDWKKFKVEFEEVHPGFFDRINKTYPDLSETYIKICAFLRIDLTSKEIADLLHVSVAAVNKNRQRLRKKLNLEAEADLGIVLKRV
ncbi:MAG: hypothetical protein DRJ05_10485 [Bacteroidetes bacterium]|nr:MAG: hypothetical protein DRJ05_10485 [Bacteroidota bacterium]